MTSWIDSSVNLESLVRDGIDPYSQFRGDHSGCYVDMSLSPLRPPVRSGYEASETFNDLNLFVGKCEHGIHMVKPHQHCYTEITGWPAENRDACVNSLVIQMLAAGSQVFVADDRELGTSILRNFPNVSSVSTSTAEHVILIHKMWSLMQSRASESTDTLTPAVLVLDDYSRIWEDIVEQYSTEEQSLIISELTSLMSFGRSYRVYVIISAEHTSEWANSTKRAEWYELTALSMHYGEVSHLHDSCRRDHMHDEYTSAPILTGEELNTVSDSGSVDSSFHGHICHLYDGFHPDRIHTLKDSIVARIPWIYPREWVAVKHPDPNGDGEETANQIMQTERVDLERLSVAELHSLRRVLLDGPGDLAPIEAQMKYDPLSEWYLARSA